MANIKHPALEWSLHDIKIQAEKIKFYPNKEEAQAILEDFFEKHQYDIIVFINETMLDYIQEIKK